MANDGITLTGKGAFEEGSEERIEGVHSLLIGSGLLYMYKCVRGEGVLKEMPITYK